MSAAPVTSSASSSPHSPAMSLLEAAVLSISGYRELIDLAYFNIDEAGLVLESLKKLDAELEAVVDRDGLCSLHKQRDVRSAYAQIKKTVDAFAREHGEQCGLGPLDELE